MSKVIAFDLDDVLCYRTSEVGKVKKYFSCKPIIEMVNIANQCYERGDTVLVYTARGMTSCNGDVSKIYSTLYELTKKQLEEWGVKYHQLIMGKIHYDVFIDDKAVNSAVVKSLKDIDEVCI